MAHGGGGLCLHDVCPVLYLTHPELFTGRQAGVHVETRGTVTYAKTVTDLDSDAKFPERNVFVVLGGRSRGLRHARHGGAARLCWINAPCGGRSPRRSAP